MLIKKNINTLTYSLWNWMINKFKSKINNSFADYKIKTKDNIKMYFVLKKLTI